MNIYVSSMSFQGLIAHFFLVLCHIPLFGVATLYLPIHVLKVIFQVLEIMKITAANICLVILQISGDFYVDMFIQLISVNTE